METTKVRAQSEPFWREGIDGAELIALIVCAADDATSGSLRRGGTGG